MITLKARSLTLWPQLLLFKVQFVYQEIVEFFGIEYDNVAHVFLFKSPLQRPNWHTSSINDVYAHKRAYNETIV